MQPSKYQHLLGLGSLLPTYITAQERGNQTQTRIYRHRVEKTKHLVLLLEGRQTASINYSKKYLVTTDSTAGSTQTHKEKKWLPKALLGKEHQFRLEKWYCNSCKATLHKMLHDKNYSDRIDAFHGKLPVPKQRGKGTPSGKQLGTQSRSTD